MKIAGAALIASLALAAATGAQAQLRTNVPPPPRPGATGPQTVGPAADASKALDVTGKVNDGMTYVVGGAAHTAMTMDPSIVPALGKTSSVISKLGYGLSGAKIAVDAYRGDTPAVIEGTVQLGVDVAVDAACASTGPGAVPCGAAYAGGKLLGTGISYGVEYATGHSIGEHVYDGGQWVKHQIDPSTDPAQQAYWDRAADDMRARHAATAAENAQANDDDARAAAQYEANRQAAARADAEARDAAAQNAMFWSSMAAVSASQAAPRSEGGGPSVNGCHPGHNESAHPGGCHAPR